MADDVAAQADQQKRLVMAQAAEKLGKIVEIGPAADIEVRDITCVAECTATAVKAWESAPWSR